MEVTFRLMQESGSQGPSKTVQVPHGTENREISDMAHEWAMGQAGHPWDTLTVETEDGECFEVELA